MQITQTKIEKCKYNLQCQVDALEVMNKKHEVLQAFKSAPVKGFREGKAPLDAIKLFYAKQIEESLKRALAESSYHEAVSEQNLKVHGTPNFTSLSLEGNKFSCEFEVYTKPDFDLLDWKNLEIVRPASAESTNEITEKMLNELRTRVGDVIPYNDTDFVQAGDNVIVSYEGFVDGVKLESLTAVDEMMTIGTNPLPGFDNNLLGMKSGDVREFDYVAPKDGLPSLSDKTIHFVVSLATGSKTIPCALDDELAAKFGKKDFAELREFVSQAAFARVEEYKKVKLHEAISKKLVAETTIDVPNWMSLSEAKYLAQQSQLTWDTMTNEDKEKFISMAEQNVKLALILDKVRDDEPEAQLTDQEVFDIIKRNLNQTKAAENLEEAIQQLNKSGYLAILCQRIKDEQAMSVIVKAVKLLD
jgi:trigger factor